MKEVARIEGLDITPSVIDILWEVDLGEYDEEWLAENTEMFIEYQNLIVSFHDTTTYIKMTPVAPENIRDVVETVKKMIVSKNNITFDQSIGSDFFDPAAHEIHSIETFKSGYEFIDLVSGGGFSPKTLTIFVGQPKIGKSLWMGNIAAKSVLSGNNTAIISLEMSEPKYIRRLGSNLLNINVKDYKNVSRDVELIKKKIRNLGTDTLQVPGKLFVKDFPTSTASAPDLENYLLRLQDSQGIQLKMVVIDYLNIMRNWRNPNSDNLYYKIKQIAEDVRAMAQRNDWAIISATQTKQSAFDEADMSMNAVSESSGLVATVDMMFAILQTPSMYLDKKYKLKVLANRDEGYKNFMKMFDVDYNFMRITEDSTPPYDGDGGYAR
jgi:replicative DNA helicase